jgi:hypothetical protein
VGIGAYAMPCDSRLLSSSFRGNYYSVGKQQEAMRDLFGTADRHPSLNFCVWDNRSAANLDTNVTGSALRPDLQPTDAYYTFKTMHDYNRGYTKILGGKYPNRVKWAPVGIDYVFDTVALVSNNPVFQLKVNGHGHYLYPQAGPIYKTTFKAFFGRNTFISSTNGVSDTTLIRYSISHAGMEDFKTFRKEICLALGSHEASFDAKTKKTWWPTESLDFRRYSGIQISSQKSTSTNLNMMAGSELATVPQGIPALILTRKISGLSQVLIPLPRGKYSITLVRPRSGTEKVTVRYSIGVENGLQQKSQTIWDIDNTKTGQVKTLDVEIKHDGKVTLTTKSADEEVSLSGMIIRRLD